MLFMLDTDTASYIIRGGYGSVERHLIETPPGLLCISAMTRAELVYGLKRLPVRHRLHESVYRFLQIMPMRPWDASAADAYADLKHQLKGADTPIGDMDMMIAAHALGAHATLVTNNIKHFKKVKLPLMMENWID